VPLFKDPSLRSFVLSICLTALFRLAWQWVLSLLLFCGSLLTDEHPVLRLYPFHSARTFVVLPARDICAFQLSLFSQAPLVPHCRRCLLPLCRQEKVMDYTNADHYRLLDALDVVYSSRFDGQCL
jgi:hypothetical protein